MSKLPPSRAQEHLQTFIQRSKDRHDLFLASKKCLEFGAYELYFDGLNKFLSLFPRQEHIHEDNPTAMKMIVDTLLLLENQNKETNKTNNPPSSSMLFRNQIDKMAISIRAAPKEMLDWKKPRSGVSEREKTPDDMFDLAKYLLSKQHPQEALAMAEHAWELKKFDLEGRSNLSIHLSIHPSILIYLINLWNSLLHYRVWTQGTL